jgi:hypothetical protein
MTKDINYKILACEHDYISYKDLLKVCSKQHTYIKKQDKALKKLSARLEDYHEKHTDCLEKNQELLKDHIEITRAYNGLHEMGKYAEELGIDIKKHNEKLPEYHQFEQKHTLLESGRVQHIYKMKKIKQDGDKND